MRKPIDKYTALVVQPHVEVALDREGIKRNLQRAINMIDFGVGYLFDVITQNKLTINYNFKKLNFGYNLLHTGSISYTKYFQRSQISITPIYSFNRYSYTNISVFIGKKWKDRMVTNLYCQNIFNSLKESRRGMNLGLGVELFLLF